MYPSLVTYYRESEHHDFGTFIDVLWEWNGRTQKTNILDDVQNVVGDPNGDQDNVQVPDDDVVSVNQ